jgi:hypothetical protein
MSESYFEFGLPPAGEGAGLCPGPPIPAHLLERVAERHQQSYPGVYILAATLEDHLCLYHRTLNSAWKRDAIEEVLLDPVGPAKGPGYILICLRIKGGDHPVPIIDSGFGEQIGLWIEERAKHIADMLRVPYRRLPLGADA